MTGDAGRREYLRGLAAGAVVFSGCVGNGFEETPTRPPPTGVPPTETSVPTDGPPGTPEPDIGPFEQVVDAVDELGCDPTGETSCTSELTAGLTANNLVRLPAGQYQLGEPVEITSEGPVGLFGDGVVDLLPTPGFAEKILSVDAPSFLLQDIEIDITAPETTAGIHVACDEQFHIDSVTYRGRGTHPNPNVPFACNLRIRNPSGNGLIRNLTAPHGSAIGHYKNAGGRGGIWIGSGHRGTIRVEDCHLEEFGNNGIYASRTSGNVEIVGGLYRNNNVAGIRFGGEGSYAENVTIEVDLDDYSGPRTRMDHSFFTRGIVIEQGPEPGIKDPGAAVIDCDIAMRNSPSGGGAISMWAAGRTLYVRDTRIRTDIDGAPGILRAPMNIDDGPGPSEPPRYVHLENVEISGTASGGACLSITDAPNCLLENCRIQQSGTDRHGIEFINSPRPVIDGGSIISSVPLSIVPGSRVRTDTCLVEFKNDPTLEATTGTSNRVPETNVEIPTGGCLSPDHLPESLADRQLRILETNGDELYYEIGEERSHQ